MKIFQVFVLAFFGYWATFNALAGQEDPKLDSLFQTLITSKTSKEAQAAENLIWKIWLDHKKPSVSRIMAVGIQAMNAGSLANALLAFDEVVKMAPEFAEGWNKRATVYYLMQDFPASVEDIAQTLRLEPRHFGALSGLGLINLSLGRHKAAIKAFEQALAIHPHMTGIKQNLKMLREAVRGEET